MLKKVHLIAPKKQNCLLNVAASIKAGPKPIVQVGTTKFTAVIQDQKFVLLNAPTHQINRHIFVVLTEKVTVQFVKLAQIKM